MDAFNHPLAIALFCRAAGLLSNNNGLAVTERDFYTGTVQDLVRFEKEWPEEIFERPVGWKEFEGHLVEEMARLFCAAPSSDVNAMEGEGCEMAWMQREHVKVLGEEIEAMAEDLEGWRWERVEGMEE